MHQGKIDSDLRSLIWILDGRTRQKVRFLTLRLIYFALRQIALIGLINCKLETPERAIGKQCRPISDAVPSRNISYSEPDKPKIEIGLFQYAVRGESIQFTMGLTILYLPIFNITYSHVSHTVQDIAENNCLLTPSPRSRTGNIIYERMAILGVTTRIHI